jgi:4-amino-4-deoxy-L-arabinose transferase-like glycosyltransferase
MTRNHGSRQGLYGLLSAIGLALSVVWVNPGPEILYGVDAGCYARVATEMADRPIREWATPTLAGEPFYDHPPLGFWMEASFLRILGPEPENLVALAQLYASAIVLVIALAVWRATNIAVATLVVLAFPLLPGFAYEAHNPMLEMPFALGLSIALLGLTCRGSRISIPAIAVGFATALLVKGPPGLVLLPAAVWVAWDADRPRRAAVAAGIAAGAAATLFVAYQIGWAYVSEYAAKQVMSSALGERDTHAIRDALFYPRVLWRWYAAGVVAVPVSLYLHLRPRSEEPRELRRLRELGYVLTGGIVLGFSLVPKKNAWYIHPAMIGFALIIGSAAYAALPRRWSTRTWRVSAAALALYLLLAATVPQLWTRGRAELRAIHALPAPIFPAGSPRRIAHCGHTGAWKAGHLFALKWNASLVPCDQPAPFSFDGNRLLRRP